jgi:hypothetical protein
MPSDLTIAITSVSSGGFALLGVVLANRLARSRERAAFRTETALELASMERLVWSESRVGLQEHVQRQQSRLTIAGVPDDLVRALGAISIACWQDVRAHVERTDGLQAGIRGELLAARRAVHGATHAELLREGTRASRRRMTLTALDAVANVATGYELTGWLLGGRAPVLSDCETIDGQLRRR